MLFQRNRNWLRDISRYAAEAVVLRQLGMLENEIDQGSTLIACRAEDSEKLRHHFSVGSNPGLSLKGSCLIFSKRSLDRKTDNVWLFFQSLMAVSVIASTRSDSTAMKDMSNGHI